jgi:hypothetical protein
VGALASKRPDFSKMDTEMTGAETMALLWLRQGGLAKRLVNSRRFLPANLLH